jgi:multisubunit Na+/H+ antiporter MnhE subunit
MLIGLVFWVSLSGYDKQIFISGLIVSFIVSGIVLRIIYSDKPEKFSIINFLLFIPFYFIELLKSIGYMIYFIFSGKIKPNIKEIKLLTRSKVIQECIAFSITNLPGSVAISSDNKSFVSHSIMFDKNYVDSVKKIETYFLKILGG